MMKLRKRRAGRLTRTSSEGMAILIAITLLTVGAWGQAQFKVLHSFNKGVVSSPTAGVILDIAGNLYGTAGLSVYKLTREANGKWTESVLHSWNAGIWGGLTADPRGNLYGAIWGVARTRTVPHLSWSVQGDGRITPSTTLAAKQMTQTD